MGVVGANQDKAVRVKSDSLAPPNGQPEPEARNSGLGIPNTGGAGMVRSWPTFRSYTQLFHSFAFVCGVLLYPFLGMRAWLVALSVNLIAMVAYPILKRASIRK